MSSFLFDSFLRVESHSAHNRLYDQLRDTLYIERCVKLQLERISFRLTFLTHETVLFARFIAILLSFISSSKQKAKKRKRKKKKETIFAEKLRNILARFSSWMPATRSRRCLCSLLLSIHEAACLPSSLPRAQVN